MSKHSKSRKSKATTPRPTWFLPVVTVVAVLVVLGVVLVLSRSNQPTLTVPVKGQPNLIVDKMLVDFGIVRFEKPVTAVFNVSNTGDKPLQILGEPRVELLQGC